ncbi:hypothetical protein EJ06DRAFT_106161 [Trichodelitschia bisporula]|uniref:Uncharacterized protein n=1 Tax=Trichodelitschia bisporula TaxID=703511 RepID=A0A6G1HR38_9PEZI|nr:hypothetical protein EJ06DRAFT_106161 [Trichodelitschia bisporula]
MSFLGFRQPNALVGKGMLGQAILLLRFRSLPRSSATLFSSTPLASLNQLATRSRMASHSRTSPRCKVARPSAPKVKLPMQYYRRDSLTYCRRRRPPLSPLSPILLVPHLRKACLLLPHCSPGPTSNVDPSLARSATCELQKTQPKSSANACSATGLVESNAFSHRPLFLRPHTRTLTPLASRASPLGPHHHHHHHHHRCAHHLGALCTRAPGDLRARSAE